MTIRAAYRERARRHHPDRRAHDGSTSDLEMAAINEAYRVLGDEARRAAYDLELDGRSFRPSTAGWPTASAGTVPTPAPVPGPPPRIPWKLAAGMAVIGIAGVLVGAALREPAGERAPDGVLRPGSCVELEPNGDAREVNCAGNGDLTVEVVVEFDASCPAGTEPHRDRQGLGIACVIATGTP